MSSNFNGNYHDHRGQVQNEADSETNVQGSGDSPSNALLTETWETSDERRGVTCDVSECSGSGELENPCASAEEEIRKNQWQSHRNKYAKIRPDEVYIEAEMPPFCIQVKEILKEDSGTARFKGLRDVKLQKVAENIFFGRELPSMYLCVLYSSYVSKLEGYVEMTYRGEEGCNFLNQGFSKQQENFHMLPERTVFEYKWSCFFVG